MNWELLQALIDTAYPRAAGPRTGLGQDELAACDALSKGRLPRIYRDYLAAMGSDASAPRLFGGNQRNIFLDEDVAELAGGWRRYFKVSRADDPTLVVSMDLFLDLDRSDGLDAPLVGFECTEDPEVAVAVPLGFSVCEQFASSVFRSVAVDPAPLALELWAFAESEDERAQCHASLSRVIAELDLRLALPRLDRVVCARSSTLSVLIEACEPSIRVTLAATDRVAIRTASEQMRDMIPELAPDDE